MGGWRCDQCSSASVRASRGNCTGPLTARCGADWLNGRHVVPLGLVAPACTGEGARDLWDTCPLAASDPSVNPDLAEVTRIYRLLHRFEGRLWYGIDLSAEGEAALSLLDNELARLREVETKRRRTNG